MRMLPRSNRIDEEKVKMARYLQTPQTPSDRLDAVEISSGLALRCSDGQISGLILLPATSGIKMYGTQLVVDLLPVLRTAPGRPRPLLRLMKPSALKRLMVRSFFETNQHLAETQHALPGGLHQVSFGVRLLPLQDTLTSEVQLREEYRIISYYIDYISICILF